MNQQLTQALLEKNVLKTGTEFQAKYLAKGLDGIFRTVAPSVFIFRGVKKKSESIVLRAMRKDNEKIYSIDPADVIELDGMDPARLAGIFNIKADGSTKKVKLDEFGNPIRPGRKPKHVKEQIAKAKVKKKAQSKKG